MTELADFPSATAQETIAFCWDQVEGQKVQLVASWIVMTLTVVVADVVCPLIFASILARVAHSPPTRPRARGSQHSLPSWPPMAWPDWSP